MQPSTQPLQTSEISREEDPLLAGVSRPEVSLRAGSFPILGADRKRNGKTADRASGLALRGVQVTSVWGCVCGQMVSATARFGVEVKCPKCGEKKKR